MPAPKLYLNENLSWKIAFALRQLGYDVISSYEAGLNESSDPIQMAFAVSEKRTIITNNFADFRALDDDYYARGETHYGVVFCLKLGKGEMIRQLTELLNTVDADDLINQVRWLNEFKVDTNENTP